MKRREMLTLGWRQLAQALAAGLTAAESLAGWLMPRQWVPIRSEVASLPLRGREPRKFSKEG